MNEIWISSAYEDLMTLTVDEVFHVLFQNRELTMVFNSYIYGILGNACWDQAEDLDHSLLASNGRLARVRHPKWAQRDVFFRDRGRGVRWDKDNGTAERRVGKEGGSPG